MHHPDSVNMFTWFCFLLLNILRRFLSSRVFIKILFQELAEYMGLPKLNERLKDP